MSTAALDFSLKDTAEASAFEKLCEEVQQCKTCPRMAASLRVLGPACGRLDAPIMFVGEAPGRLGADASAIPFHGDKAGHNFEDFLKQVGISRYDVFVTNSALCNPRDTKGNNSTPNREEIQNCSTFLARQISIVNPKLVVTLGAVALAALKNIEQHNLAISQHVRTTHQWFGRMLIPLYHPGQRALVHRSRANQLSDYYFVAEQFRRLQKPTQNRRALGSSGGDAAIDVVNAILAKQESLSYFALHKIFYLAECTALKTLGRRMTQSFIVRQKDGPYCVDLHATKLKSAGISMRSDTPSGRLFVCRGRTNQLSLLSNQGGTVDREVVQVVEDVLARYGQMTDAELKRCCYMTTEMRLILKKEKLGHNSLNTPLLYAKSA